MAASSSSSSAAAAVSSSSWLGKRRREDASCACGSELSPHLLALLSRSVVLHTGVERPIHEVFTTAISVLPFSGADAARLLAPLADAERTPAPFLLRGVVASMLLLTPMFPALRVLSVRDAAAARLLGDLLCLDATGMVEDDLVQRYVENPFAEADWRGALTVAGCPACDTLWAKLTASYAVLRGRWKTDVPAPASFGASPSQEQRGLLPVWQQHESLAVLTSIGENRLGEIGFALIAPMLVATLQTSSNIATLEHVLFLLRTDVPRYSSPFFEGCGIVLARFYDSDSSLVN